MRRLLFVLLLATIAALAACERPVVPPRGDSDDYAREVDDVNERNRAIHERTQKLDQRLAEVSGDVERLRAQLAPLSAQWAYDAHRQLGEGLAQARERVADLTAATGVHWESMALRADEAIDDLEATRERIGTQLAERAGPSE